MNHKNELEDVLRWQLEQLLLFFSQENLQSGYFFLPIAGILRVLLCDAQRPVLIDYAEAEQETLKVYGPRQLTDSLREVLVLEINTKLASWLPFEPQCQEFEISNYLDAIIGQQPIPNGEANSITPRQLIKWVSNKDGVSHLAFDKPATFTSLKSWKAADANGNEVDSALVREGILQIGQWAIHAIQHVLNARQSFSIVVSLTVKSRATDERDYFSLSSDIPGCKIVCKLRDGAVGFEVAHPAGILAYLDLSFPENLAKGDQLVFSFSFDADTSELSVWMGTEQLVLQQPVRLSGFAGQYNRMNRLSDVNDLFENQIAVLYSKPMDKALMSQIMSLGSELGEQLRDSMEGSNSD